MFSTVMLHQVIHGDGTGDLGAMSYEEWALMNKGLEDVHKDIPAFVTRPSASELLYAIYVMTYYMI